MKYRKLGRTGLKVSEVSVGTEWLEKKSPEIITSVIRKAIKEGVNYFDIIFNFEDHLKKVSKAIEGSRDNVVLKGRVMVSGNLTLPSSSEKVVLVIVLRLLSDSVVKCSELLLNM